MDYRKFTLFNVGGAAAWVVLMGGAGWFFGGFPYVQSHFEVVVIGIIVVSMLPAAFETAKHVLKKS